MAFSKSSKKEEDHHENKFDRFSVFYTTYANQREGLYADYDSSKERTVAAGFA
jgi:hypothetical protein